MKTKIKIFFILFLVLGFFSNSFAEKQLDLIQEVKLQYLAQKIVGNNLNNLEQLHKKVIDLEEKIDNKKINVSSKTKIQLKVLLKKIVKQKLYVKSQEKKAISFVKDILEIKEVEIKEVEKKDNTKKIADVLINKIFSEKNTVSHTKKVLVSKKIKQKKDETKKIVDILIKNIFNLEDKKTKNISFDKEIDNFLAKAIKIAKEHENISKINKILTNIFADVLN